MIVISYATIGNYKFLPTKINSKDNACKVIVNN
jgi:hypothetical protein